MLFLMVFGCKDQPDKPTILPLAVAEPSDQVKEASLFEDLNGQPVALSEFNGKKILLNYWATWCRPCIEEMPALLRAQEVLKNENYVFLLASDQSLEKIQAFVDKRKFDFRFIRFKGAFSEIGVNALPTTFIYNESGEQVLRIEGQTDWDSQEAIERFKALQ